MTMHFEYEDLEFELEAEDSTGEGLQVFLLISGVTKRTERIELEWAMIHPHVYAMMQAYFYENYYSDQQPDGAA